MRIGQKQKSVVNYDYYTDDPIVEDSPSSGRLQKIIGSISIVIAAAFFINSTLAANVSLNSGANLEFGQGVQQTTACSGTTALTVTPLATFSNSAGGGSYNLASIKVSNIPDSCFGSDFTLNVYGERSTSPLAIFNTSSTDAVIYNNAGTFQAGSGSTGMTVASSAGEFTATFAVPAASTPSNLRITIQSGPHKTASCALGGTCVIGDTGPGGGKVFYVSVGGFSCGVTRAATCHYLELAPTNWNGGADPMRSWAQSTPVDYTNTTLILSAALGYGALNTKAIIDQGNSNTGTSAAAMAASYSVVVNGATINDWFLPSENDWFEVWNQRTVIGFTATGGNYWTSSSVAQSNGRYFIFSGTGVGGASGMPKGTSNNMFVRPARAF